MGILGLKIFIFTMRIYNHTECQITSSPRYRSSVFKVDRAISAQKKKDTVNNLKNHLDKSILAVSLKFQGLTVAELQEFRTSLPSDAHFTVAKKTLIGIATNELDG